MRINHPTVIPTNFRQEMSSKEKIAHRLLDEPKQEVKDVIRDYRAGEKEAALSTLTALAMMRQPECSFSEMKNEIETIVEETYA